MLVRGQNLVGYHHYSKDIVDHFIKASYRNGIEVFRVFDALNDIRNIEDCAVAIKDAGAHFEGAISYTVSPVHTLDSYLEYAQALKSIGADSICIKDMAGMLTRIAPSVWCARCVRRLTSSPRALPLRWRHGAGQLHKGRRGGRCHSGHRVHAARLWQLAPSCGDDSGRPA